MAEEIRFDGRVAVITGAGGGLGRSHALLLASRGAKVVVNDLGGSVDGVGSDTAAAQQVVNEIKDAGGEAVPDYNSVSEWDGAQGIIQTALDNYGKIDILINNAGILRDKTMLKMEIADWEAVIQVHLSGTFYCTKAALPNMQENNYGRLVFTASAAGLFGNFGQCNYGAAKLGTVGLMNTVKLEGSKGGKFDIKANTLIPFAGTRLSASVVPPNIAEKIKPEYNSPAAAYLCSEQCKLTGAVITAGPGYFGRAAMVEGPGVFFDDPEAVSVEDIAGRIDEIASIDGAAEFEAAPNHVMKLMSHTKLD